MVPNEDSIVEKYKEYICLQNMLQPEAYLWICVGNVCGCKGTLFVKRATNSCRSATVGGSKIKSMGIFPKYYSWNADCSHSKCYTHDGFAQLMRDPLLKTNG